MGLFASRPEEPSEWAGLPSEPAEPGSPAETLEAPIGIGLEAVLGASVTSIAVPVVVRAGMADDPEAEPGAGAEPGADADAGD
ncbi:hypothetical protein CVS47_01795 [Microbacterium lemovicicum]|uniref:Uncharacterized protein n=1 Tax=Microbacterium lemovicicum TaxID=1072463 RepID=A0A3Q9J3P2_9MICO|nr:hypothetical protein [Microbacterium lemovicicum]AZS37164.1 hypothetical protein CVS47_01795 [Microbacterium lemovicicum]